MPPDGRVAEQSTPASPPPVDDADEADTAEVLEERELLDPPAVVPALVDELDEPAALVPMLLVALAREPELEAPPEFRTLVLLEPAVTADDDAVLLSLPVSVLSEDAPHAMTAKTAGAKMYALALIVHPD